MRAFIAFLLALTLLTAMKAIAQSENDVQIVNAFAPLLMHPANEPNLPANVDWFLPKTSFSFYNSECLNDNKSFGTTTTDLLEHGIVTSVCGGKVYFSSGTRSAGRQKTFIISDVADPYKAGLSDASQWMTYYHIYDNDLGGKTIQYWSFYAYNTGEKIGPLELGYHGGDWEMVGVILDQSGSPSAVFMTGHTHIEEIPWRLVQKQDGHPIFFTEKGGHEAHISPQTPGSYIEHPTWSGGLVTIPGQVARKVGPLIDLGSRLNPKVGFLSYSGLWGSRGLTSISSGYWGPAFNETGMPSDSFLATWCYRMNKATEVVNNKRECYPDDIE